MRVARGRPGSGTILRGLRAASFAGVKLWMLQSEDYPRFRWTPPRCRPRPPTTDRDAETPPSGDRAVDSRRRHLTPYASNHPDPRGIIASRPLNGPTEPLRRAFAAAPLSVPPRWFSPTPRPHLWSRPSNDSPTDRPLAAWKGQSRRLAAG